METGFGTGSTAVHMLAASASWGGNVLSIDWSEKNFNHIGKRNLERSGYGERHQLIERPSFEVMAELLIDRRQFDFVFVDGWKSFDYLAYECFVVNQLLPVGGCLMFDDAQLPSMRKLIKMLVGHYQYEEIDYIRFGQPTSLRIFQILTCRSLARPYRAFVKTLATKDQGPMKDGYFYSPF